VVEAADGNQALTLLDRHRIELVITDLEMPALDGFSLISRVRNGWPTTLIVLISGYLSQSAGEVILGESGYDTRFFQKPWHHRLLWPPLKNLLPSSTAHWEASLLKECHSVRGNPEFFKSLHPAVLACAIPVFEAFCAVRCKPHVFNSSTCVVRWCPASSSSRPRTGTQVCTATTELLNQLSQAVVFRLLPHRYHTKLKSGKTLTRSSQERNIRPVLKKNTSPILGVEAWTGKEEN
jgi:CheY-like chemotaxis protein